jgi:hypothetical protein
MAKAICRPIPPSSEHTDMTKRPNFFILGAPKCGTTSLAQWLSENPRIYMSPIKEPHYYNRDLNYRIIREEQRYLDLFANAEEKHLAIGEGSVWYLYSQEAVANILKDIPEAKFIICLRNPVDMAYSLHGQMMWSGYENITDFRTAWRAGNRGEKRKKVPRVCKEPRFLLYGSACSLAQQTARLFEQVPRERVLPVFLDDMRNDPLGVYENALKFLNVPYDGETRFPVVNVASEQRLPRLHAAISVLYSARKNLHLPRLYAGMMFKPFIKWNIRPSTRAPIDSRMRNELYSYFRQDIYNLEQLLGRNLQAWKPNES